ncbi:DHA1 family bicyclomycin/chloramphenicol resistance-like MFS transporter [Nitrospirillum amazonense]|uniref:Bcr/CflA family efflux transporter n=1 Tax=Nitrospirillum amazonense TaxID=28077 RepID=A0A560JE10_9PROT|nr:multidrug effflux MFS transporter [Nitrospirillum amazonense]TWB69217.1 DHA1 family bicyclomycin/chloramphenicol resistance-like MFS transporter [Nitrospirillum amazonense]
MQLATDAPPPDVRKDDPHAGIGFTEFVLMVSAMMAMNALGTDSMLPALGQIGRSLDVVDEPRWQWIVTAFLLGFGGAQILYGPISDRYGRRPILLWGIVFYALGNLAAALAPTFELLLAVRVVQGIAVASTRIVVVSVVRDCYAGRQMARVMSLAFMILLAVPILAPSLGQLIMLVAPWRAIFACLAAYALAVVLWLWRRLPETLHPEYRRPIDVPTILSAARQTVTDRQAIGYTLAQTLMISAVFAYLNSMPPIFDQVFKAPQLFPLIFALTGMSLAVSALLNARIVVRLGTRRLSHSALLGFILFTGIHTIIARHGESLPVFTVLQALTMFCFGLATSNFGAMAMEPVGAIAGTAASVQGFISTVLGALVGFVISQHFDGTTLPLVGGFLCCGVGALAIVLVTERFQLFHPRMGK